MDWSPQQANALDSIGKWIANSSGSQVFRLFGYAGTGKTTLARHIAELMDGRVSFAAYTGKAASVMRARGCHGAITLHQLIYNPTNRSRSRLRELSEALDQLLAELPPEERASSKSVRALQKEIAEETERLKRPGFVLNKDSVVTKSSLVVVDECSMVDAQLGQDLLSFGVPILVLGDPAQLPPVGSGGFFTSQKPDVLLTEIHRQARDSPVIHLATMVREGKRLQNGTYGDSLVMRGKLPAQEALVCDQLIVGRNQTRRASNDRMRQLLGRQGPLPMAGDKLVCLRNNHEEGLLNGTLWNTLNCDSVEGLDQISLDIRNDEGQTLSAIAHRHYFEGREEELDYFMIREANAFDYGYALTCHKAQGSQWGRVLVADESYVFKGSQDKWLYTAITRASDSVVIVRN